jgi:hypothetical protein
MVQLKHVFPFKLAFQWVVWSSHAFSQYWLGLIYSERPPVLSWISHISLVLGLAYCLIIKRSPPPLLLFMVLLSYTRLWFTRFIPLIDPLYLWVFICVSVLTGTFIGGVWWLKSYKSA